MRKLVALALLLVACGKPLPSTHEVVVCDARLHGGCDAMVLTAAAQSFLATARPGSRFEILLVGAGASEPFYRIWVPISWGPHASAKRKTWLASERLRLASLRLPERSPPGSVASTLWRAAELARESKGSDARLIVISRLVEHSGEFSVNMARHIPPPAALVNRLRTAHLLPNLSGIAVEVCRVGGGAMTVPGERRLRAAWQAVFAAAGAPGVPFTSICTAELKANVTIAGEGE